MRVLGLGGLDHNGSAAVLEQGQIRVFLEAERVVRRKNVGLVDPLTVTALLDELAVSRVDAVAIADQAFWRERREWLSPLLTERFGPVNIDVHRHHDCHAFAALAASPWPRALCATIDGKGDGESANVLIADRTGAVERLLDVPSQHSLGRLWWGVSDYCGFPGHHSAGKIMALAAHGAPRRVFDPHLALDPDGGFRLLPRHLPPDTFRRVPAIVEWLSAVFDRPPGSPHPDAAASVQHLTVAIVRHVVGAGARRSGHRRACLSGGVALNGLANQALVDEGCVEELYVPPCPDDRGLALGAASLSSGKLGVPVSISPGGLSAFLGPPPRTLELSAEWAPAGLDIDGIAERLASGAIVAWFAGADEAGPRALGHRSILASPTFPWMRDRLNLEIKRRESFRPFGCSVLAEHAAEWLALHGPSPYMLRIARIREGRAAAISAVVHADGTSRPQTVTPEDGSGLWPLLRALQRRGHPPMVLNTSLNGPGEPIAHSVTDAATTASVLGVDMLVVEGQPYVRAA